MSAFVVDNNVIDAILEYGSRPYYGGAFHYFFDEKWHEIRDCDPAINLVGQALINQNYASVNHRYTELDIPPEYIYKPYRKPISAIQMIKACDCYMYQACETDNWEQTEAFAIVDAIRERAIHDIPGWEEAAWGVP